VVLAARVLIEPDPLPFALIASPPLTTSPPFILCVCPFVSCTFIYRAEQERIKEAKRKRLLAKAEERRKNLARFLEAQKEQRERFRCVARPDK